MQSNGQRDNLPILRIPIWHPAIVQQVLMAGCHVRIAQKHQFYSGHCAFSRWTIIGVYITKYEIIINLKWVNDWWWDEQINF